VIIVSNAGPLIALGKLGQLGLLLRLYDRILIPREVYREVVVNGLRLGAPDARAVDFLVRQGSIQVVDVTLSEPLPDWALPIDAGEAEVIILGQNRKADWVLIDNAHARRAAHQAGLSPKGTVGVLLAAFRQGYLSLRELELLFETTKERPELWISESLCDQALAQARRET
jgi:predicted nucleic acid-binding protein